MMWRAAARRGEGNPMEAKLVLAGLLVAIPGMFLAGRLRRAAAARCHSPAGARADLRRRHRRSDTGSRPRRAAS